MRNDKTERVLLLLLLLPVAHSSLSGIRLKAAEKHLA
jgi:hypothetical protein